MGKDLFVFLILASSKLVMAQSPPINQIRVLASHNSYKCLPESGVIRFLNRVQFALPGGLNPNEMDYGHVSLEEQLDTFHIRGLELDVYADPKGGAFYKRRLPFFIWGPQQKSLEDGLLVPGIKILHIKDVDYQSNVQTWKEAMFRLKNWSDAHPDHSVVFVNIEVKSESPGGSSALMRMLGFKRAPEFDDLALKELSDVALENLGHRLFTPADLRGEYPILKARISQVGWPTVEETKSKFIFILEGLSTELQQQVLSKEYCSPFFYYGSEEHPEVVFVLKNNSRSQEEEIKRCVTSGLMVRTRADEGTYESRKEDYSGWEAAIRSHAQIISTDYYRSDRRWSGYKVSLPNQVEWENTME